MANPHEFREPLMTMIASARFGASAPTPLSGDSLVGKEIEGRRAGTGIFLPLIKLVANLEFRVACFGAGEDFRFNSLF